MRGKEETGHREEEPALRSWLLHARTNVTARGGTSSEEGWGCLGDVSGRGVKCELAQIFCQCKSMGREGDATEARLTPS